MYQGLEAKATELNGVADKQLPEAGAGHGVHQDVQHPLVAQAEVGAEELLAGRSLQLGPEPAFQAGGCGENI